MQPMQSNAADVVNSAQNKEMLWTTLQESGAFTGLTREQFQPVQLAFDRSVQQASRSMSSLSSLSDVNKHIIRQFVQTELPMLRSNPNMNPTPNQTQNPKKKKIEMVYRAEDLQTERASEFDRQLREKQAEMDSFLTLKKPTDVSFTDAASAEDKPIGGEMSRLIAQELAARERELVQLRPEDIKKAQQWIGTTTDNNSNNNNATKPESHLTTNFAKKSVSFSEEEHEVEQFEPDEKTNAFGNYNESNGENFEETDFIFSKFKKIQSQSQSQTQTQSSVTMQQLYTKLVELEQSMNAKHAEIMARLNVSASVMQNQFDQ
jgi:hypothetical protein